MYQCCKWRRKWYDFKEKKPALVVCGVLQQVLCGVPDPDSGLRGVVLAASRLRMCLRHHHPP